MISGIVLAIILHQLDNQELANQLVPWIALPGELFLGLLKMVMVPLVISSLSLGITGQRNNSKIKKLTILTVLYFVVTTTIAIIIGIGLATWLQPGRIEWNHPEPPKEPIEGTSDSLPVYIYKVFPTNPLQSILNQDMLSIVIFSFLLGLGFNQVPLEKSKTIIHILESILEYCMVVVNWALKIAPIAVMGLMAKAIYTTGLDLMGGILTYFGTVVLGLLLVLLLYALLLVFFGKIPIFPVIRNVGELQLLAFSASSSAAVLPVSLKTAIEKLQVRDFIAEFVIPLGATINMNGTAIYQVIATLFIAQIYGISLSEWQLATLIFTVVGASIGTAATPGVGIVILSGILVSYGIPTEGIAIIFGIDRFLDMLRTTVNVTGDIVASKIIDQWID